MATLNDPESGIQQYIRAIVFGPPGKTKSGSSVTMSEKCPPSWSHVRIKTVPPKMEAIVLDDLLWVQFDSQALFGFSQLGVAAPCFDLSATLPGKLDGELRDVVKQTAKRVADGVTKTVIVDTVSALDEMLLVSKRDDGFEQFDLYREILGAHLRFAMGLKALKCNMLFLCHAKTAADTVAGGNSASAIKMAENASKKQQAWGTGGIIPAITGAALNHYRRDVSMIFSVTSGIVQQDGKPVDGFWFHTRHREFDTKSRLILPDVLPADWRIVKKFM